VSERSRSVVLITALVVPLLLAATAAAIVITQHVRDEGPVVSNIFFKRRPAEHSRACFSLTRDDTVTVALVNSSDQVVRVLADAQPLQGGTEKADAHCYEWDGTDDAGNPVPPGPYRLRFELRTADRTATSGEHVVIHSSPGGSP
jgi:FlgD Ig-like domain